MSYLKVTKVELDYILDEFKEQCLRNIEEINEELSNKKIIDRVFGLYFEEIEMDEKTKIYTNLEDHAFIYKDYLQNWLENKGSFRSIFNKYLDGTNRTNAYYNAIQTSRENTLKELVTIILLLNIIYQKTLEFGDSNFFLTKKTLDLEKEIISLLNSGKTKNLNDSLVKINLIMERADEKEHLYLLDKKLKIILLNYRDKKFIKHENTI